jgi:hypothetical protein
VGVFSRKRCVTASLKLTLWRSLAASSLCQIWRESVIPAKLYGCPGQQLRVSDASRSSKASSAAGK